MRGKTLHFAAWNRIMNSTGKSLSLPGMLQGVSETRKQRQQGVKTPEYHMYLQRRAAPQNKTVREAFWYTISNCIRRKGNLCPKGRLLYKNEKK